MPHEYNNFRLAIAKLGGNYPDNILAFTDSGGTISVTAYTRDLKLLWQHTENRLKDHLGHYVYAVDLNKDGIDEVVTSPPLVLDAAGRVLWNRFDLFDDNHDHCDSLRFYDIDGDGQLEFLAPQSEAGVVVFRSRDGAVVWRRPAEHSSSWRWETSCVACRVLRSPSTPEPTAEAVNRDSPPSFTGSMPRENCFPVAG